MMICKADFEELFPHIFKPQAGQETARSDQPPYLASERRCRTHYGRAPSPRFNEMVEGPVENSRLQHREMTSLS